MSASEPKRRLLILLFALPAAALLALAGRVVYLQVCRSGELSASAWRQQRLSVPLPARPGNILARTRAGRVLLAGSRRVPSVYADPVLLGESALAPTAGKVAEVLGCSAGQLYEKMRRRRDKRFVYLARGVSDSQAKAVRKLRIRGVRVSYEWRREYPNGSLAAHVLGFRRIDGVAAEGIESKADSWLGGADGLKVIRSDVSRRGMAYADLVEYRRPEDGRNVVLTLDVSIQSFLEEALSEAFERFEAAGAMGVVMDPNSGEILAMASRPTFDPNRYGAASANQRRNRTITDPYEPGSAMKPFIGVGAIQMEKATLQTTFYCENGTYRAYRGGTIRDFPGERFGDIPMTEGIIHSSNIYMAKLGERLGNESLHRIARAFGFGMSSGVDLPGESPGRLVPTRRWSPYATRRLPFGQGPIMVTTLQLANAFSAIANGGVLLRPRIIDRVVDAYGDVVFKGRRGRVRRVLSADLSRRFIDEVLVKVVREGTGRNCQLEQWQVFGKTGTAQIGGPGGYEEHAYTATFAAGAPAGRPAVVCVISVYRPNYAIGYTGGSVAAPYVRQVLRNTLSYLDVPGDKPGVAALSEPPRRIAETIKLQ